MLNFKENYKKLNFTTGKVWWKQKNLCVKPKTWRKKCIDQSWKWCDWHSKTFLEEAYEKNTICQNNFHFIKIRNTNAGFYHHFYYIHINQYPYDFFQVVKILTNTFTTKYIFVKEYVNVINVIMKKLNFFNIWCCCL